MYKPFPISQDCCAKLFYQVPYISKQLFWLLNSPQTIPPNKVIKHLFPMVFLDTILHQSKLNQFILSPPSPPGESTENICGVLTPAAIWQLHCESPSQGMLQDEDSSLAIQQVAGTDPGFSFGKSGMAEEWSTEQRTDSPGSEYNETNPGQIYKYLRVTVVPTTTARQA